MKNSGPGFGIIWFIGWLFTIGYAELVWWKIILGIVVCPGESTHLFIAGGPSNDHGDLIANSGIFQSVNDLFHIRKSKI